MSNLVKTTFTRASISYRWNGQAYESVAVNTPVADYIPGHGWWGRRERNATSLTYNARFSGTIGAGNSPTGWSNIDIATTGATIELKSSPFHPFNAVKLSLGSVQARKFVRRQHTLTAGVHTVSCIVESYSGSGDARFFNSPGGGGGSINLADFTNFNPAGPFPQRIWATFTPDSDGTYSVDFGFGTGGNDLLASVNDEITFSGPQIEAGPIPTSPIFAENAGDARSADAESLTNVNALIGQEQGTLVVPFFLNYIPSAEALLTLSKSANASESRIIIYTGGLSNLRIQLRNNAGGVLDSGSGALLGSLLQLGTNIAILRYFPGGASVHLNGSKAGDLSFVGGYTLNDIYFQRFNHGSGYFNNHTRNIRIMKILKSEAWANQNSQI